MSVKEHDVRERANTLVHGLSGIRVVGSAVAPCVLSGGAHSAAATTAMAERAADIIKDTRSGEERHRISEHRRSGLSVDDAQAVIVTNSGSCGGGGGGVDVVHEAAMAVAAQITFPLASFAPTLDSTSVGVTQKEGAPPVPLTGWSPSPEAPRSSTSSSITWPHTPSPTSLDARARPPTSEGDDSGGNIGLSSDDGESGGGDERSSGVSGGGMSSSMWTTLSPPAGAAVTSRLSHRSRTAASHASRASAVVADAFHPSAANDAALATATALVDNNDASSIAGAGTDPWDLVEDF